ncbi:hypothetical protein Taro_014548, partial [Colocasia esculenta]|nr:hypothetical protein [Colocasia esculenta]
AKWSSSVDTRSGSVDIRDPSQNTFWANLGQCVDTRSGSVDTRDLPRIPSGLFWDIVSTLDQVVSTLETLPQTPSGPIWDSVSTLDQVVSTLETFTEHLLGCFGTVCRH